MFNMHVFNLHVLTNGYIICFLWTKSNDVLHYSLTFVLSAACYIEKNQLRSHERVDLAVNIKRLV